MDLWFKFKINNNLYAIDCAYLDYIGTVSDKEITKMADAADHIIGVFKNNNVVVTLLSLRKLLGLFGTVEETENFMQMIDNRMYDCEEWGNALKTAITDKKRFTMATNPHESKFGKWYDSYEPKQSVVTFQLIKIDTPHIRIHELAEEYNKIFEKTDEKSLRKIDNILEEVQNSCLPEMLDILEETKRLYKDTIKENFIRINEKTMSVAFTIDEIVGIEKLEIMPGSGKVGKKELSDFVNEVARDKNDNLVMIIDVLKVLKFADTALIDK